MFIDSGQAQVISFVSAEGIEMHCTNKYLLGYFQGNKINDDQCVHSLTPITKRTLDKSICQAFYLFCNR